MVTAAGGGIVMTAGQVHCCGASAGVAQLVWMGGSCLLAQLSNASFSGQQHFLSVGNRQKLQLSPFLGVCMVFRSENFL
jgi:hypothetical protein